MIQVKKSGQRAVKIVTIETPAFAPVVFKATVTARKRRMAERYAGDLESGQHAITQLARILHDRGLRAEHAYHAPSYTLHKPAKPAQ